MRLVSIDPGAKSGIAVFVDGSLAEVWTLRPRGASGAYALWSAGRSQHVWASRYLAWITMLSEAHVVVCEQAWLGLRPGAAMSLARQVGYIEALAQGSTYRAPQGASDACRPEWREVTPSEWRRVARETWGRPMAWPSGRDEKKALAVALVRERWGITVSDDEADAVLIGWWALMTSNPMGAPSARPTTRKGV